jgi:hypothetical protein
MNEESTRRPKPSPPRLNEVRLSEDWWAVIIGLGLAALIWAGVITQVPWPLFGLLK